MARKLRFFREQMARAGLSPSSHSLGTPDFDLDNLEFRGKSQWLSKRGGPVSFLQIHPSPAKSGTPPAKPDRHDVLRRSHPLLLIVAGEESKD
uniref:Uncharacterized protein n=1 Tax=Cucumis melo TaxID=3656 RepID=A0A9I9E483_CUCME